MVQTSLDILYLALAAGFIVLVVFISITLTYVIFLLRDLTKTMDKVEEITERVNEYLLIPAKLVSTFISHAGPFIEMFRERFAKAKKKKSEKD